MTCYQDKTFCTYWVICKASTGCDRVLTEKVKKDAAIWYGKPEAPICIYSDLPPCFIPFFSSGD